MPIDRPSDAESPILNLRTSRRSADDLTVTEAGLALTDPAAYADEDRLHNPLGLLRCEAPVHWVKAPGFDPFWAVTRHLLHPDGLAAMMTGAHRAS